MKILSYETFCVIASELDAKAKLCYPYGTPIFSFEYKAIKFGFYKNMGNGITFVFTEEDRSPHAGDPFCFAWFEKKTQFAVHNLSKSQLELFEELGQKFGITL